MVDPVSWINSVIGGLIAGVAAMPLYLRLLIAGFGMMCETSILLGLVVPGDVIALVAATGTRSPLDFASLVLALVVGALLGETIGFSIGRYFGPKLQRSRLGRLIKQEQWEKAKIYVARRGGPAIFLSRFLPVFHSVVPAVVGMSAIRYRRFMLWTTPACIVWAVTYVTVGTVAGASYELLLPQLKWASLIFVGIVAVFFVAVAVVKRFLGKRAEKVIDETGDPSPGS